jgi:WD40 repeat protein
MEISNASDELWDPCMRVMEGHTDPVASVASSPDGTRVVSGSFDRTLRIWDAVSGEHHITLRGYSSVVNSVSFSPDGTLVVSGSDDGTLSALGRYQRCASYHSPRTFQRCQFCVILPGWHPCCVWIR